MDEFFLPSWSPILVGRYEASSCSLCSGELGSCFCRVEQKLIRQPWVFFNLPAPDFPSARRRRAEREERELQAAAMGQGGEPKKSVHHEPPSLEQAIANLKLEHTINQ